MSEGERSFDDLPLVMHGGSPAVLGGAPWDALSRWTPDYLRHAIGELRPVTVLVAPREVRSFLYGPVQGTLETTFGPFLDTVFGSAGSPTLVHYLWASGGGCWTMLKGIEAELQPPARIGDRDFNPDASGLWIGQAETRTLIHCDSDHGLIVQVKGQKRVLLFPPVTAIRYQLGLFAKNFATKPSVAGDRARARAEFYDGLKRTLRKKAEPIEVVLDEGSVLYIPPYWWHEVENLTPTIAVSLRYAPSRADTLRHPRTYKAALWHHGKGYFLRWAKLHRPKAASG